MAKSEESKNKSRQLKYTNNTSITTQCMCSMFSEEQQPGGLAAGGLLLKNITSSRINQLAVVK